MAVPQGVALFDREGFTAGGLESLDCQVERQLSQPLRSPSTHPHNSRWILPLFIDYKALEAVAQTFFFPLFLDKTLASMHLPRVIDAPKRWQTSDEMAGGATGHCR